MYHDDSGAQAGPVDLGAVLGLFVRTEASLSITQRGHEQLPFFSFSYGRHGGDELSRATTIGTVRPSGRGNQPVKGAVSGALSPSLE
jgi:hypothetical protein